MTRIRRANAGAKTVGRPHSVKTEEITELFIRWGIIGQLRQINPVVKLMPYFDRGPGFAADKGDET
jgi:hypothetical protein